MPSRAQPKPLVPVAGFIPLAWNLRTVSGFRRLLLQDCLLSKVDQQLPLAGHVPGAFQQIDFVERLFATGFLMRTQEIIVSDPEGYAMAGTFFRTVAAGNAVGFFKSAVQPFYKLFERTEFFGYLIAIGQADNLGDENIPVFLQFELLCGQGMGAIAVSNELQGFAREFFKFIKGHAHSKDAGADIPGRGDLVTEDGAGHFIHNKLDIGFDSADFNIGFICCKFVGRLIIIWLL